MSANESKIPVGQVLVGKYRVVREIGRGGMAAVYESEQLSLGKKVAVKVLAAELSASTIVIERFFREARAAASVSSPYIVDVYDSGRLDDGRPFIAMELLEGESLYDRMARVRIIDVETTIRCIVHTAKGLVKAHAAGIVHRDLKPENIFLTKGEDGDDVCKILDFGLAKFYAPVNPEEKAQKRLTREGAVFGTPAYMSPEQVKGQGNVDHRADLWAVGCMAFECLIGRPVWNMDQGVAMTFAAIATGPIPVPSQIRADLPKGFDDWFAKCLQRDPEKRYQSAKELADAFVAAWGTRPGSSSASFPNVVIPGSGKHAPPLPTGTPQSGVQELGPTEIQSIPPGGISVRSGAAPIALENGRGSVASEPLPLVNRSSNDAPPISHGDTPRPSEPQRASPVRIALSAVFFAASISTAIFVWVRFLHPQVFAVTVQSTATAQPSTTASANGDRPPPGDEPKWISIIAEGQRLYTASNVADAQKKFQDAINLGGPGATVGKVFADQLKNPKDFSGSCKPVSFARPRLNWDRKAERPAIIATPKGSLVTWIDDHEQKDKDHVYGVLIDNTGKSLGPIRDLTPEAADAQRPQLVAQGDRSVLMWSDTKGNEAGIHVRYLDGDGRIDPLHGQSVRVNSRPGESWPSIDHGPNGFIVAWQGDRDKEKEHDRDLFVRLLSNELGIAGHPETRLTDFNTPAKAKPNQGLRVRIPSVAIAPGTVFIAYRLEDEKKRVIVRQRIPLDDLEKPNAGLIESKDPNRSNRVSGDVENISDEKLPGEAPAIACGKVGCFAVWHGEPTRVGGESGGAWVALLDPTEGKAQWKKKISDKGGHPSLAVNDGQVAVAYYEAGRLKMAYLSSDGVGPSSTLLRVHDVDRPRPALTAGVDKNEWSVAWQDSDVPRGTSEIFASRVVCGAR